MSAHGKESVFACAEVARVPPSVLWIRSLLVSRSPRNLGISESSLRRWMDRDHVDVGREDGLTSAQKRELVELRRRNRVLVTEIEILKRPVPTSRGRTSSQNRFPAGPRARLGRLRCRRVLPGPGGLDLGLFAVAIEPADGSSGH